MQGSLAVRLGWRVLAAVPTMLIVAALLFAVLRMLPLDPAVVSLPFNATAADIAQRRIDMGLDRPLPVQFALWLGDLMQGDLGRSTQLKQPVLSLIAVALPQTIELAVLAMALATVVGIGGALVMFAARTMPLADGATDVVSVALLSIPEFLWALSFILLFGVALGLLPVTGRVPGNVSVATVTGFLLIDATLQGGPALLLDVLTHMVMPVAALGLAFSAAIMRVLRSSLLDVYQEDFITQARLSGQSETAILFRHGLPNALLPTLNLMGVQFGFLFGGTLLLEVIFAFPGIGFLMVNAVRNVDLPLIQGLGLVYCLVVIVITITVDMLSIMLNPRLGRQA